MTSMLHDAHSATNKMAGQLFKRRLSTVLQILCLVSVLFLIWTRSGWIKTRTTNKRIISSPVRRRTSSRSHHTKPPPRVLTEAPTKDATKSKAKQTIKDSHQNVSGLRRVESDGFVDPSSLKTTSTVPYYVAFGIQLPIDAQDFGDGFKESVKIFLRSLVR